MKWALRLSGPGTVIIGDNVVHDGEVANANSSDPKVQGVRTFCELLAAEPRVSATAIQTVGKGMTDLRSHVLSVRYHSPICDNAMKTVNLSDV